MKRKIALILSATLCLSACETAKNLNLKEELDSNINNAIVYLNTIGFQQTGESIGYDNELVVTGVSYSTKTGYGTRMGNNYIHNDSYYFINNNGNTIEFSVSYQEWTAEEDTIIKYYTYDTIKKIIPGYNNSGGYRPDQTRLIINKRRHTERPKFEAVRNVFISNCKTSIPTDFDQICNCASPVKKIALLHKTKRAK